MAAGYAPTGAVILTPCPIIHIFLSFFKSGLSSVSPSAKRNEYFNFLKSMNVAKGAVANLHLRTHLILIIEVN